MTTEESTKCSQASRPIPMALETGGHMRAISRLLTAPKMAALWLLLLGV